MGWSWMTILRGFAVWIRVTETFRWKPNAGTTIVYKPGTYNVPRACAALAVAAGKAVRLKKTNKDSEPWPESEPAQARLVSA